MKKQPVFAASMWSGFMHISCVTALMITLGSCGFSDGGTRSSTPSDSGSDRTGSDNNSADNGEGSSTVGESIPDSEPGSAPAIKFLSGNDGMNGMELWKTSGNAEGTQLVKDFCLGPCNGHLDY